VEIELKIEPSEDASAGIIVVIVVAGGVQEVRQPVLRET
jgi:hypothetical protein